MTWKHGRTTGALSKAEMAELDAISDEVFLTAGARA